MTDTVIYKKNPFSYLFPEPTHIHLEAYHRFLQDDIPPSQRKNIGLELLFRETFPIKSYDGKCSLEFISYEIGQPRYTPIESVDLKISYSAPLRARLRLNKPEPIEEFVYLGDIPLMVGGGEFIINGIERIIVNQLHRSPGVDVKEEIVGERKHFVATVIPQRGSWLEINTTKKDIATIKVDQGTALPVTIFLRAMDENLSSNAQIIKTFHQTEIVRIKDGVLANELTGKYVAADVVDPANNKTILRAGEKISVEIANYLRDSSPIQEVEVLTNPDDFIIINTLSADSTKSTEEALLKIYSRLRPGMPPQLDRARAVFNERFFDVTHYQLGQIGRFRINRKFGLNTAETEQTLLRSDIIEILKYLIKLRKGSGTVDDIDDLSNRRIRCIDELAYEEIRRGFYKLKRLVTERLSAVTSVNTVADNKNKEKITPRYLVDSKIIVASIDHFFERSELSQVVDQTNPLSLLTHEKRLSALGPGGLNRKRAGFEVRDVHPSHYGRICPVETPEGANIGLITSLATFARVDKYGFLVTPYRVVKNGNVTDEIHYLRADEEKDKVISPPDILMDKNGKITTEKVLTRYNKEFKFSSREEIHYIDVSPYQLVGISAGLIPFLEHDDANRALMGSNMQRQAVPLIIPEPALVGTGLEKIAAENSSMVVKAEKKGVVTYADADKIIVKTAGTSSDDKSSVTLPQVRLGLTTPPCGSGQENIQREEGYHVYELRKFSGLKERTCLNQKPCCGVGDSVRAGQIIADGPATSSGELSLGCNVLVAFMPWEGYNFEDAIIVSERLLKDSCFSSIHIEDFEAETRETKFGKEEFTRDIPNVPEKLLKNLDEHGIAHVGMKVKPGDILIGKIAPKSKKELSPEEKLLHAIFGKVGEDVKNMSVEVPPGVEGIVIETQYFSRYYEMSPKQREEKERQSYKIERSFATKLVAVLEDSIKPLEKSLGVQLLPRPITYGVRGTIKSLSDLREKIIAKLGTSESYSGKDKKDRAKIENILSDILATVEKLENEKDIRINKITRGDDLLPGVLEMTRVRLATKRKLSVGDKIAGRHGNKGVVARILPEEEMPFLEDGTPVDILLNPLGVPSRMNVGQILETHLEWAAKKLGIRVLSPIFDGATEKDITELLIKAGLPPDGKVTLYDGRTGESFAEKITVGFAYIMKLHHLVDDKIHARATGPYSLITQQPLGGRARAGGQRLGEMEVWALEAYGSSNCLQEMLTVKSDDVDGRTKIYESIIKGENVLEPSIPISFEVLTNEIKGLGLSIKLEKQK
ncbi:MAG: DNA-directed RNA polymerase subunit beta [Planctomycetota bacterium]|nr:DNA-directed RNA polymerase subunit beta [Planctomycetota bacterium]MDI6786922.1 DNA-directed RNA polymerase subunit beta [Planctomycetota bacterium]